MPNSYYLKLEDPELKGECQEGEHKDWIELTSFNYGVAMEVTRDLSNTKRTSGRPTHAPFVVEKWLDITTPKLFQHVNEGKEFKKATVAIQQNEGEKPVDYMKYDFENVILAQISKSGTVGEKPTEQLTFSFNKVTLTYTQQGIDTAKKGQVTSSWNQATNAAK